VRPCGTDSFEKTAELLADGAPFDVTREDVTRPRKDDDATVLGADALADPPGVGDGTDAVASAVQDERGAPNLSDALSHARASPAHLDGGTDRVRIVAHVGSASRVVGDVRAALRREEIREVETLREEQRPAREGLGKGAVSQAALAINTRPTTSAGCSAARSIASKLPIDKPTAITGFGERSNASRAAPAQSLQPVRASSVACVP
jgi:hypothetical protein